jgi:hypothetical protein
MTYKIIEIYGTIPNTRQPIQRPPLTNESVLDMEGAEAWEKGKDMKSDDSLLVMASKEAL